MAAINSGIIDVIQITFNVLDQRAVGDIFPAAIKNNVALITRSALLNAASVSALMLTTECMISEMPKEDKGGPAMGGMPPGAGMY